MKQQKIKHVLSLTLILSLILMLHSSCTYAIKGVKGNGNVVKQERSVSAFDGIDVGGAFRVYATQGDKELVVVEADENLQDIIETEVRGSTLKIRTTEDISDSKALNIYITFKTLKDIDVSGACHFTSENKFELDDLELDCSGASDATLKFSAANMEIDCSGASKLELFGSAEHVNLDLSGASHLDAMDMEAKSYEADVSGASHGKIMVMNELSVEVSGAGSLKYKGDPSIKRHDVSGAGSLKKY